MFFDKLRRDWQWTGHFFFVNPRGYCITFLVQTLISIATIVCCVLMEPYKWVVGIILAAILWIIAFAWLVGYSVVPLYRESCQSAEEECENSMSDLS